MSSRRKRKIKLPIDSKGMPIHVGDYMAFDDGVYRIEDLTYMGEKYGWYASASNIIKGEDDVDIDNLGGGTVL